MHCCCCCCWFYSILYYFFFFLLSLPCYLPILSILSHSPQSDAHFSEMNALRLFTAANRTLLTTKIHHLIYCLCICACACLWYNSIRWTICLVCRFCLLSYFFSLHQFVIQQAEWKRWEWEWNRSNNDIAINNRNPNWSSSTSINFPVKIDREKHT